MRKGTYSEKVISSIKKAEKGKAGYFQCTGDTLKFSFIYKGEICDPSRSQLGTNCITSLCSSAPLLKCHCGFSRNFRTSQAGI